MKFLLQSGNILTFEKFACIHSGDNCDYRYRTYDELDTLNVKEYKNEYVPVGSVEFVRKYCKRMGITLPDSISYLPSVKKYIKREIREGTLDDANENEFVKPKQIKLFTGNIKKKIGSVPSDTKVWISDPVIFESEFRFYIKKSVIMGWCRYDLLYLDNPDPDINYVNQIIQSINNINSYVIDIGWRPDLKEYDLVELNDAWALGLYNCRDRQSTPPTNKNYANMLISRWKQISSSFVLESCDLISR